jgi:PAS domain S-box-containing protein
MSVRIIALRTTESESPVAANRKQRFFKNEKDPSMPGTDLKEEAEEFAHALALMQATLEASPDGMLIADEQGRITTLNAKLAEMWRMPQELIKSGDIQNFQASIARRLKNPGRYLARMAEIEASNGQDFYFLELSDGKCIEQYSDVISIEQKIAGRVWSFRNATHRQESDLIARRLAAIVDNSDDAIIGKDLNSIITSWNKGAERIFGYSADEIIGTSVMRLIPPDLQWQEQDILARLRRGERYDHFETVRVAKDGRQLHVSLTISPIKDANGKVVGASKIARDITDEKLAEKALNEARKLAEVANAERERLLASERAARSEAERASRMKDEFLATLSHELRTPLNAVLGWATALRMSRPKAEDLEEGLETIERNARVQAQLLQVVLDPLDAPVSGDPNRLQQVFWNLLSNAIKFTPRNGRVQVLLERVNSHVEVSVIDTGEGIAPEFLPYIFERFKQADPSTTRRYHGLGLGLAIVKQLVELHGGSVCAKSGGLGKGATFIVSLPLMVLHPPQDSWEREHPKSKPLDVQPLPTISLSNVAVLVVDDEPDARNVLKRLLESAGALVYLAQSAEDGMQQLLAKPVEVLICDIGMPDQDGYSFIRRIRSLDRRDKSEVAAVALTAYARSEDRTEAIRAGFQNHLPKPVEPAELLAVVHSLASPRAKRP